MAGAVRPWIQDGPARWVISGGPSFLPHNIERVKRAIEARLAARDVDDASHTPETRALLERAEALESQALVDTGLRLHLMILPRRG